MIDLEPQDRVLCLSPVEPAVLLAMADRLTLGILVCLAPAEHVGGIRREVRDAANVMVVPQDSEGLIPWKDEFFSVVLASDLVEPSREILRVLAPGGCIHLAGGAVSRR